MEQVQLLAQLAVVALLGFFQHVQVLFQVFFLGPGRAVDTLQHFVIAVTTPVGTGYLHQLEYFQLAGRRYVRATAQVGELAFAVQAQHLIGRNGRNDLGLVGLADTLEVGHGVVTRQLVALYRNVFLGQLLHLFLDGHQVFRGKRALVGKIVVKAVFDFRADGDLGFREQLFHRISQQVGGGVADDGQAVRVFLGDDGQVSVGRNTVGGINQLAVHATSQRRTRKTGSDGRSHFVHRYRLVEGTDGTVGQANVRHSNSSLIRRWTDENQKKSAARAALFRLHGVSLYCVKGPRTGSELSRGTGGGSSFEHGITPIQIFW